MSGSVRALVLTYQDRLLRFGRELIFPLCSLLGIKVTVLDDLAPKSPAAAFPDDVLAIITVFSAHLYGARAHRPKPLPPPAQLCPSLPATASCPIRAHNEGMPASSPTNPFALFETWFSEAQRTEPDDATAMSLATASPDGRPAVPMVLLKGADARGFVFYTHATSPKGRDLAANPRAAPCFHWAKSERQVCVEGRVVNVLAAEADAYFASRPRLSQIGAWASRQSEPASGSFELEQAVARESLRFGVSHVPHPPQWLGFRVVPDEIEFWHQRAFRHQDRQRFTREGETWRMPWLFP